MKIAVASGKGGTGKTTVSTNLAKIISRKQRVQYIDCDVEEPNGHLFLKPGIISKEDACIPVPEIDAQKCTNCGKCGEFCRFHAIASFGSTTITFPNLCHGCGGCAMVCPSDAIAEIMRPIGVVETGCADVVSFVHGRLNIGEAMSPPLIRSVLKYTEENAVVIMDAPPGTSCPMVAAVRDADKVLLVTEPTAFGLNDLVLAVETISELGLPFGVFLNRADMGDDRVERYCEKMNIPIWGRLPHDRKVAESYSRGGLAVDDLPHIAEQFEKLAETLLAEVGR